MFPFVPQMALGLIETFTSDGQHYIDDLSLTEAELMAIEIYPNPSSHEIRLTNNNSKVEITVYDLTGKQCISMTINGNQAIDVRRLSQGRYNIQIKIGQSFIVKQLIIQ